MKRYSMTVEKIEKGYLDASRVEYTESPDGEWVKFEDVKVNEEIIFDELIERFIAHQYCILHDLQGTYDRDSAVRRYRIDPIFYSKVRHSADAAMAVILKHVAV